MPRPTFFKLLLEWTFKSYIIINALKLIVTQSTTKKSRKLLCSI